MTVAQLREEMPQEEYVKWYAYYGLKSQRMELEQAKQKNQARGRR